MEFDLNKAVYEMAIYSLPILFALTMREVAHGRMADKLGDNSARAAGRLSLNPISHIDPVGTLLVPLMMIALSSGILFGWAKPVPVNPSHLNNPRRDVAYVALAGLLANLVMAIMWIIILRIIQGIITDPAVLKGFTSMALVGIQFNLFIMIINLLPLPPFDGGRILSSFLPPKAADQLAKIEPYSFFILLGLIFLGGFEFFFLPLLSFFFNILTAIFM
jgi:Zn-dependent protease